MAELIGTFIHCGKPIIKEGEIIDWQPSYVKISEIKTIHKNNFTEQKNSCIFYTYKDEWYIVADLTLYDLVELIDENSAKSSKKAPTIDDPKES